MKDPEQELREALAKGSDHVNDQILNEDGQRIRNEINNVMRRGQKVRAFKRKNKRRRRK